MIKKNFVFDFDSTFIKVETLDLLGEIALSKDPAKTEKLDQIKNITDLGMEGKISFRESLEKRISLLNAHKDHLPILIEKLKKNISTSFERNKEFLQKCSDSIYIISNGFKDFILPIVADFGLKQENVYANTFEFDQEGNIVGFDPSNVLSNNNGKVEQLRNMKLQGDIYVIGDGYTDYEIRATGLANKFYAFTENVERSTIIDKADHIVPSLDEFLYQNNLVRSVSYPKNRINVLLLENIHPRALELMQKEGYNVEIIKGGLDEDELSEKIKNVSILGIRSKTQVTRNVLKNANRLVAVGAFCIGTNQIDLKACAEKGIAVFNAPFSNTRSVVELVIGELILLMRDLPDNIRLMHNKRWNKSAANSYEIRGKSLGIIGYGNIGAQLSVLAEALGMKVFYYDVIERLALGNAVKCNSMEDLFEAADIITVHVDGRKENKNLIGDREFDLMKPGTVFMNLSRGHVVDIEALKNNLESGKLKGAAIDVFPEEPKNNQDDFESELQNMPNTILTPHIGGSTQEAQENIASFVPNKVFDYINTGSTTNSVNFPNLQLPFLTDAHRLIHIHHNVPGILAMINQVLAEHKINIVGQYLKTNENIGYVITDIDKEYDHDVIGKMKSIENTIRFRILY